jgi:hypothetical protein
MNKGDGHSPGREIPLGKKVLFSITLLLIPCGRIKSLLTSGH